MTTRKRTDKVKGHVKKSKADAEPKEEGRKRGSAPNSGSRTTLQKHVDFFDSDRDGKITFLETYQGLRRLGFGAARSVVFGGVINAALGSSTSRTPSLTVDADHINAGKHASDTGVYDQKGHFVQRRFDRLFARYDEDEDGALDREELARLFEGNRTDLLGHLGSMAEFGLLLYLAGEDQKGRKVLTRQRLKRFYDGSLFYQLADEVAARRAEAGASLFTAVRASLEELY
jgi:peroxygenase